MNGDDTIKQGKFLDFRDLLQVARQQFLLIALTVALGLAAGVAYVTITPKQYTATAEIVFETRSQKVSNIEAVLPGLSSDRSVIESQIEILMSQRVFDSALEIIRSRPLAQGEQDGATPASGSSEVLRLIDEATASTTALSAFRDLLAIERRGLSYIVTVSFTHTSPELAAKMANAVVEAYIETQREEKIKATTWASERLQARVRQIGQEVHDIQARLQTFKSDNDLLKIGELEVSERLLTDQINRLVDAQVRAIQAETAAMQIKSSIGDPDRLRALSNVLQSDVILEFRRQYAEVQRQLATAINRFGENHVSVANARAELQNLQNEIDGEIDRLVKSSLNELEMARQQVELLRANMEQLKEDYASRNSARIELSELERRAAARQQLYVSLFNRLLETEAQVGLQADDARINTYARTPERPSWPKSKLLLAAVMVASAVAGFGLGLLRETLNSVFRSGRDVVMLAGLEPVAEFPKVAPRQGGWFKSSAGGDGNVDHTRFDAGSDYTRALVKLHRWLQAAKQGQGATVVLVASAHDGDGKSTLASNLAQFEWRRGRKVLLVDSSSEPPEGGDAPRAERYPYIYDAENPGGDRSQRQLICLRSGAEYDRAYVSPNSIADGTIVRHIREANSRYDLIVLDTPALLSFAHTASLLEVSDCSLFVIRAGKTTQQNYIQAFGQFLTPSSRPVGLVINMFRKERPKVVEEPKGSGGGQPTVAPVDTDQAPESKRASA